jgi:sugar transferase (PEP-CTERM system associated)
MAFQWFLLIAVDVLLSTVALFAAAVGRLGYTEAHQKLYEPNSLYSLIIFVAVVLFASHLMDVYDLDKNRKKREIIINIMFGTITSFSLLSIAYYLDPDIMLGRGIVLLSLVLFSFFQFCWHACYLAGRNNQRFSQRVLVLGTGALAAQIGDLAASRKKNLVLAGYTACANAESVSNERERDAIHVPKEQLIGSSNGLMDAARRSHSDILVVALSERRGVFPLADVLKCKLNGLQIMDAPSFYEFVQGKLMLESITPSWIIFSSGFRTTTIFNMAKRTVDIVLASVGLMITLPFFPLIALAIKLDSHGPIFFRQIRVGSGETPFLLYKFRTMKQDAETETGAIWAQKNDPRVTRLGRFFRGSRIDEIPQLINVLKGEMSFIGPRPERPEFVEKLKQIIPYYSKRHFIKPGLTGWAQVRYPYGASIEDAVEKLRYDLYYTKNICPFLDTLIFFETIKVVLFGRGGR